MTVTARRPNDLPAAPAERWRLSIEAIVTANTRQEESDSDNAKAEAESVTRTALLLMLAAYYRMVTGREQPKTKIKSKHPAPKVARTTDHSFNTHVRKLKAFRGVNDQWLRDFSSFVQTASTPVVTDRDLARLLGLPLH